jgi:hypothetical protein
MRRVFLSSTSRDLLHHRERVNAELRNAGYEPIDMINFGAQPGDARVVSLDELRTSDIFVGIYAYRYGYCPPGSEKSVTEMELDEAERLGKPCFIFIVENGCTEPLLEKERESNEIAQQRLQRLIARLESNYVRATFTTPADLAQKVVNSLSRWDGKDDTDAQHTPDAPTPPPIINNIGTKNEIHVEKNSGFVIGSMSNSTLNYNPPSASEEPDSQ